MARRAMGVTLRTDGRYELRFTLEGKRHSVFGHSVQECKEKEIAKRKELADGLQRNGKNQSFNDYYLGWIEDRRGTVKGTTIHEHETVRKRINRCVIDGAGHTFGSLKIKDISVADVKQLQKNLAGTIGQNNRVYSTSTVNLTISKIKTILKAAVVDRLIVFNPADGVRPLQRKEEEFRDTVHRALTVEETKAFFAAADASWYHDLYVFLINTGCRVGEACALTFDDFDGDSITINKTVTRDETGKYIVGDTAKTKKGMRKIPLTEEARRVLESQKRFNIDYFGNKIFKTGRRFFPSPNGLLADGTHVGHDMTRVCERAGIDHIAPHALRDTFATRAIESGMSMKTLQEILGHADIGLTMNLYAHVMEETKVKEMASVRIAL